MKKFAFLVPVAAAAAALSTEASANVPPQPTSEAKSLESQGAANSLAEQVSEISYTKGDELHSLMMRRTEAGQVFAQHMSHSSHGSHGSHQSHRSGS